MKKSKIFKFSIIYILIVALFFLTSFSFVYGVKVGLLRQDPLFSKVRQFYDFSQNFKLEIKKFLNKKNIHIVKKNSNNQIYSLYKENLDFQNGSVPEEFVVSISLSLWEGEEVKHKLIFISGKEILHEIAIEEDVSLSTNDNLYKWPHGLIIEDEKFVYFNFDGGNSISKKNLCGKTMWTIPGNFHHLMSLNKNYIWALKKEYDGDYDIAENFVKIDKFSGKIISSFNVNDLITANQPNDYFSIKQRDLSSLWEYEPFHFNDVDVLTKEYSKYFKNFSEGDLMISSRSLNSIFVLDPTNLKVKKFLFGLTRRQHDPDWNKGYISIYDNQTEWKNGKRFLKSRIVKLENLDEKNIKTLEFEKDFMSDARGNHEVLEYGNKIYTLIVSPYEGKLLFFEDKKNIFTIINSQTSDVLPISNAKILNKENFLNNLKLCK